MRFLSRSIEGMLNTIRTVAFTGFSDNLDLFFSTNRPVQFIRKADSMPVLRLGILIKHDRGPFLSFLGEFL